MRDRDGMLTRKGLVVTGTLFIVLSLAVLAVLFTVTSKAEATKAYAVAEDTAAYIQKSYAKLKDARDGFTVSDLLSGDKFNDDPAVFIARGQSLVAANVTGTDNLTLFTTATTDVIPWDDSGLASFTHDGAEWLGMRAPCGSETLYLLYRADSVYSSRWIATTGAFLIFLVICVIVLIVRSTLDKRTLKVLQRQFRIVNAISETFSSIFLVHLEDLSMVPIKMTPNLEAIYRDHPEPLDFLIYVLCDLVVPESREVAEALVDLTTFDERLRGRSFLAADAKAEDGTWYSIQVIPQRRDADGNLLAVLVALRDVTEVKRAEELSYRDKLTGLRNRNYLEARGNDLVREADYPVSLIMADCNYLKRTNDTLGHECGDELLRRVAKAISSSVNIECPAIRLGGDEFLLICPHTDRDAADKIVARIERALSKASDDTYRLSVSFGTSQIDDPETPLEVAFKAADHAMYEEKKALHEAGESQ